MTDYIHIKNLERYQPHYNDGRAIIWVRWDVAAVNDYKISKLSPAQRWLFIGLICMASKLKNKIPLDFEWISHEIRYPEKSIPNDINYLQELGLALVTKCDKMLQDPPPPCHKMSPTNNTNNTLHTNKDVVLFFDYFLLKTKKAFKLTHDARELIKRRFSEGYTMDQLKKSVDNFVADTWEGRKDRLDLIYCIGKQQGKPDNLEKWLNIDHKEVRRIPS